MIQRKFLGLAFYLGAFLSIIYIIFPSPFERIVFWVAMWLLIISLVTITVFQSHLKMRFEVLVMVTVFAIIVKLPVISNSPFGLDPWYDMSITQKVAEEGSVPFNQVALMFQNVVNFPGLHLFTVALNLNLMVSLSSLTSILPVIFSLITVIAFYQLIATLLISLNFSEETRDICATTGTLALVSTNGFFVFHSLYIRETFVIPFIIMFLWSIVRGSKNLGWHIFRIFLIVVIIFSHHLSTAVLMFFLFAYVFCDFIFGNRVRWLNLVMIFVIGSIGYWLYLKQSPISLVTNSIQQLAAIEDSLALPKTFQSGRFSLLLRLYQGLSVIWGILAMVSMWLVRKSSKQTKSFILTTSAVGFAFGVLSLILLFIPGKIVGPQRFELFGFYFLFIGSSMGLAFLLTSQSEFLRKSSRVLILCVLLAWIPINIYRLSPGTYSRNYDWVVSLAPRPWLLDSEVFALDFMKNLSSNFYEIDTDWTYWRINRAFNIELPEESEGTHQIYLQRLWETNQNYGEVSSTILSGSKIYSNAKVDIYESASQRVQ